MGDGTRLSAPDRPDAAALALYLDELRRALRLTREPAAQPGDVVVDPDAVRWRRMTVSHVARRLPTGCHADAAAGGLQDSAPRAAQLQLHARMAGVTPDAWEHPALAQIWLRWADYVVPRADLALFTLGAMPRDEQQAAALEALADVVVETVVQEEGDSSAAMRRVSDLPYRSSAVTGRVLIRWDARSVEVIPTDPPACDREAARLGLARRFLHWYGPATPSHLSKFAGIPRTDAEQTFAAIDTELVPVSFHGRRRWLLAVDLDGLMAATRPNGIRFLPAGDPVTYMNDTEPQPPARLEVDESSKVTPRLLNSLTSRLVVDGQVVGAWGRVRGDITIDAWRRLDRGTRTATETEGAAVASAVGFDPRIRWLTRPSLD